jgi:hypothetical protein
MDAALAPAGLRVTSDLGFGAGPTDYPKKENGKMARVRQVT